MLTQEQITLVKKTWRILRVIDPQIVAGTFYAKLFNDHPRLKKLFPKELDQQNIKLMDMLNAVVTRLDRLDEISEEITAMAERHVNYGVKANHYDKVGHALLWTLKIGLGNDWTPAVEEAWTNAYTKLAEILINTSVPNNLST